MAGASKLDQNMRKTHFFNFFEFSNLMFSRFLVVFEGPGGFKQLRDTCRMNFHHSSYLYVFMVPSYDKKTAQHRAPISPLNGSIGVNKEIWLEICPGN